MSGLRGHTVWSESNRRRFEHWSWTPPGDGPFPLLVLLHGVYEGGGSCWWLKGRAVETLDALALPLVVLMASDTGAELGTGYCDWADGTTRAETHILDELIPWAESELPVAGTSRHIAGLSMGGYGAFLLALRRPGLFESASSMSGFFDPSRLFDFVPDAMRRMWGTADRQGAHDVRRLAVDPGGLRMAFDCGLDDPLLPDNRRMHILFDERGIEHGYAEHPGGHDWDYWSARLPDHLHFALRAPGPLAESAGPARIPQGGRLWKS